MGWTTACAAAALTFLKLVANEVHFNQQHLHAFEKTEFEEYNKRLKEQENLLTIQSEPPGRVHTSTTTENNSPA